MLAVLKNLWLYNPDFSQYVANIVNLGNPGHQLSVDARNDATAEAAVNRLNDSASRLYEIGCGVDGLLNQYLTSVAWSGAISSEDVVNLAGRRVEKVVLVPVEQIRFRYNKDLDTYEPYQKSGQWSAVSGRQNQFGLLKLNTETYKYLALSTVENSPYAKPPATAAIDPIIQGQQPLMKNLQYIVQKFGLLGLVTASLTPPPKRASETDGEYQARAAAYLKAVATKLESEFSKGLLVTFRDQKLEHTNVAEGAKGLYDVNRISEEQVFSGLAAMPGFHGRTDSTTETFADVVYYLLTAQVGNMQRIVKRRQEMTYMLDLRLGGIDVNGVSLQFNKAHSRNALNEAQTDAAKFNDILARVKAGAITPDEGAHELGYDAWADEALLFSQTGVTPMSGSQQSAFGIQPGKTIRLNFDKQSQKYRHQPETIEIWSGQEDETAGDTVVPFIKKKALQASN